MAKLDLHAYLILQAYTTTAAKITASMLSSVTKLAVQVFSNLNLKSEYVQAQGVGLFLIEVCLFISEV
jgi:hypothetical protein